ncbi:hypothetical protein GCM10022415_16490 [Knoellia locipacati]|uniref:Uncharacterized protein n=1 Tax=Knoellia locipacati TaxID=882824 RepID=A0A512T053_9MICO|nr:hypothetical protein KLO01_16440 [Knoellia locipacati]
MYIATSGGFFAVPKPELLVGVDDDRTREHALVGIERDRHGLLVPVDEVTARRVAPGHVAPAVAERVVLEEQVVDALVEDEPVGVVHPVLRGAEVVGRTVLRRVRRRRRDAEHREGGDDEQDDTVAVAQAWTR